MADEKAKYTPGPWVHEQGSQSVYALEDGRNRMYLHVDVRINSRYASPAAEIEAIADCVLIAAAPEPLEACRYMHKLLVDMGHGGLAGAILGENAIAKAEGRNA